MPSYVFKVGANYGDGGSTRAEPGDVLGSVPPATLTKLLDAGALVVVADAEAAKAMAAAVTEAYSALSKDDNEDRLTIESRVGVHLASLGEATPAPEPSPTAAAVTARPSHSKKKEG